MKTCRKCGETDQGEFYDNERVICKSCRKAHYKTSKEQNRKNRESRKLQSFKATGDRCLEAEEIRIYSQDVKESFTRICQGRRDLRTKHISMQTMCQYCTAHKLVDAGVIPVNVTAIERPV